MNSCPSVCAVPRLFRCPPHSDLMSTTNTFLLTCPRAFFRADQQGGAHQLTVEIMDSLTIHCPHYNDSTLLEQTETAIIYRVSKHSFDNCVLDETSKPVAQCSDPFNVVSIRLVFRRFTPLPSGLEYQPGETYYFIFSLPYRSSSPERHSSVFLHVLLISVCLAVRRIFCSL
uniref:Ephrin RBD domain-containing protein n=1 Tax=Plectus sambesii TaxID=2011161 RepID=A0A914XSJ6_9BILA